MTADYNVPLEKGDVVQTGSEGMAKIVFGDGTNYTVKQDSLIVIEENSANEQQQTSVSVAVSTGTVDLATATYMQGSKSQVIVAGATASLAPNSARLSAGVIPGGLTTDGQDAGDWASNADCSGEHDADFQLGRIQDGGVFLDAHAERGRIPVSYFAEPVFLVHYSGSKGEHG